MIYKIHLLKWYRKNSQIIKQDVAYLLGIKSSNLTRYEKGNRNPTPEIILTYHILFGASLKELFKPLYDEVTSSLKSRSQELILQLEAERPPKSIYRLSFLRQIVNSLNHENEHEQG